MPNEQNKSAPFQATPPKIPGVPGRQGTKSAPASRVTETNSPNPEPNGNAKIPLRYLWAAGGGAILVLVIAVAWWAHSVTGAPQNAPLSTATATSAPKSASSQPSEKLPFAPGPIATTSQLREPWATQKFLYHDADGTVVPAMLVHLRGNDYWAFSLREPFGTCELEFASVDRLRDYYNLRSKYPMVGDPCTRTVYDLTQYGSGPNGLVRGEIVAGIGSRPPLAIEVQVQGQNIVASRSE